MVSKPVIFVSAVSKELHSARDLVAKTLAGLGYEPAWQDIKPTDTGDLRDVLRRWVDDSAAVVQLVGRCYGCEPNPSEEQPGRASYTQFEADYSRERGKKIWYLLLAPEHPSDAAPEPDELLQLQEAYRHRVQSGGHLYHPTANLDQTEKIVLKLNDDLAELRREARERMDRLQKGIDSANRGIAETRERYGREKLFTAIALALLLVLVAFGVSQVRREERMLQALRDLPQALAQTAQAGANEDETTRLARAYATLEEKLRLSKGTLQKELPAFAQQVLAGTDTRPLDKANAQFALKKFAIAEQTTLQAKDAALATAGNPVQDTQVLQRAAAVDLAKKEHRPRIANEERFLGPNHPNTLASKNNLAWARETPPHFDVNDVAFLFPPPTRPDHVKELISGDDPLDGGSTIWPKEFFKKVIDFAKTDLAAKVGSSTIEFPTELEDVHNWKVAGIRVNPASLGGSDVMIAGLQKMIDPGKLPIDAPIVPGIRLVMQPVTVSGSKVTFHDYAAHVVFNQKAVKTGPELVASPKMQSIVADLIALKKLVKTDGVPLNVHPGFAVSGFRAQLGKFLTKQLDQKDFDVVSFMGLENPGFEPWIFFRVRRNGPATITQTPIGGFFPPGPTSIMLAVMEKKPSVQPAPKPAENTPLGPMGIGTAPLFPSDINVNDPVLPGATGALQDMKLKDIPDFVANPQRANTFNTDCVSCHTETTRRLELGFVKKPTDPPRFAYQVSDNAISDVSPDVAPARPNGISWNLRVFGWAPRDGKPTISQRGANEAMESVDFFNRVFFKQ
jgi:hypothetical protein